MGTRIVITENQYKRLFLGEQRASDSPPQYEITDPKKYREYYGPFEVGDFRFTKLLDRWDDIYPNALEIVDYLGENQWSNFLQPAMEKVNKEKGLNLTYDNYDKDDSKTSKLDKYKYLWEVLQRDYSHFMSSKYLDTAARNDIKKRREKLLYPQGKPKTNTQQTTNSSTQQTPKLGGNPFEEGVDSYGRKYMDIFGMSGSGTRIYLDDEGKEIDREDVWDAIEKEERRKGKRGREKGIKWGNFGQEQIKSSFQYGSLINNSVKFGNSTYTLKDGNLWKYGTDGTWSQLPTPPKDIEVWDWYNPNTNTWEKGSREGTIWDLQIREPYIPVGTRGEDFRAMDGGFVPLKNLKDPFYKGKHNYCCNDKQKQKCKSFGQVATCKTEKGSYWDEFFGYRSNPNTYHRETPMYGGHWDNKEYTYCVCQRGEEKDNKFIPDNQTYISQGYKIEGGTVTDAYIFNREVSLELADHWYDEYRHEIIDLLAVAAFFIPVPGLNVLLSMGIEGIHAADYFKEGDPISGWLSVIFMAIPALGPIARRLGGKSLRKIYNILTESRAMKDQGKTAQEIIEYTDKELSKLTKEEQKFYNELAKPENIKKIENSNGKILNTKDLSGPEIKKAFNDAIGDDAFWKEFKSYTYGWGTKSKFLKELMNPTMVEKYFFGGTVVGMIVLDKVGVLEILIDPIINQLKKWGIIESPEEENAQREYLEKLKTKYTEKYKNIDLSSIDVDLADGDELSNARLKALNDVTEELAKELDEHIRLLDQLPKNFSGRVELINIDRDEKTKILNKIENIKLPDELETFDDYQWAKDCKNNSSITKNIEINQEVINFLENENNIRRIKNEKLGSDYQYASWGDYWFYKKDGTNKWELVTDCKTNIKIEAELDYFFDKIIDTDAELDIFIKM